MSANLVRSTSSAPSSVAFDATGFERHLERLRQAQLRIMGALQRGGQSAFYIDYDDLQDLAVLNGLAAWLGVPARLEGLDRSLKKQNPQSLAEKVENFDEMRAALARIDRLFSYISSIRRWQR